MPFTGNLLGGHFITLQEIRSRNKLGNDTRHPEYKHTAMSLRIPDKTTTPNRISQPLAHNPKHETIFPKNPFQTQHKLNCINKNHIFSSISGFKRNK